MNLRPAEIKYILDKKTKSYLLLKLIFIDLLNRKIFSLKKIESKYLDQYAECYYVFNSKTNEKLNEFEIRVTNIFRDKQFISLKELLQNFFLLDSTKYDNLSDFTTNRKIDFFIKLSLKRKKLVQKNILFTSLSKLGKQELDYLKNHKISESLIYNDLRIIYTQILNEKFNLTEKDYDVIMADLDKEYNERLRKNFNSIVKFNDSCPVPIE